MILEKMFSKYKEKMINDLQSLIRIPSVNEGYFPNTSQPFGSSIGSALEFMLKLGKQYGFRTKNLDGYAGIIEFGEGDIIGILGHVDVVPVDDKWVHNPFKGEIDDGKLYGRGAIDDKGPVIAAFYAMVLLKELNIKLENTIRLIIGTDEEILMRCMDYYKSKEKDPKYTFSPDANFPVIYAEKGIHICEWSGETMIPYFKAGKAFNVVPEVATIEIKGAADDFKQFCEDHNYKYSVEGEKCSIYGVSCHAMQPEQGVNAILLMNEFLKLKYSSDPLVMFLNKMDIHGNKLSIAYEDEEMGKFTLNVGIINVTNGRFKVTVNVRMPKEYPYFDKYKQSFPNLHYLETDYKPLHYTDKNSLFVKTLMQSYQKYSKDMDSTPLTTGGGTYARMFENGVAFGMIFPDQKELAHERDEYVDIESLFKSTLIYADALYNLNKCE